VRLFTDVLADLALFLDGGMLSIELLTTEFYRFILLECLACRSKDKFEQNSSSDCSNFEKTCKVNNNKSTCQNQSTRSIG
jgi:hypothetical protein